VIDTLRSDIRFALRSLRRRRTFAIVAIATIALAIGSATSIFSVVDAVLFRGLPYRDPGRLVAIWETRPQWKKEPILAARWDRVTIDYGDYLPWRRHQTVFTQVGLWSTSEVMLSGDAEPEIATTTRVSPSIFDVLGVKPELGRLFLPGEDVIGGPHVTVLSHESWQHRFGGRRDILGRVVEFSGVPYTVVGMLPPGFSLHRGEAGTPFWIVAGQDSNQVTQHNHMFHAIGRLAPGITADRAAAETAHLLTGGDAPDRRGVRIEDYQYDETRDVRAPLLMLFGAVALLLAIACVNIATLLLGEAASREQEISARVALGASRGRVARQLLTESVTLALVGGSIGALLAWGGTNALIAIAPAGIPGIGAVHVDLRVLGAAAAVSIATGLLFGLAPALLSASVAPAAALRASGQSAGGRGRLQRAMIAAELALSVMLLVGAVLLSRSLNKLTTVRPGFRADHLLLVEPVLPRTMDGDSVATRRYYEDAIARVGSLPGVVGVTTSNAVPFGGSNSSSGYLLDGQETDREHRHEVQQRVIQPNFFAVMGIPLLAGRTFSPDDRGGAPRVCIVSESAARRDWPNDSPIGKRVNYQGAWWTVVGIVGDVKFKKLSADDEPTIYTPTSQRRAYGSFVVRTAGDPAAAAPGVRRALRELAPSVAIVSIETMDARIRQSFGEERFRTILIGLFGVLAGVLAAVGMFGVTARAVHRRTREVGIRVALGATTSSVVRLIVGHTLSGVGIGVAIGAAGSIAVGRVLAPFLFGVSALDPIAYAMTFGLLAGISILASWLPARRAGDIQPAIVLRGE
jgi:putative ABC transport system permease protein